MHRKHETTAEYLATIVNLIPNLLKNEQQKQRTLVINEMQIHGGVFCN